MSELEQSLELKLQGTGVAMQPLAPQTSAGKKSIRDDSLLSESEYFFLVVVCLCACSLRIRQQQQSK
jgi:hypothetical protein